MFLKHTVLWEHRVNSQFKALMRLSQVGVLSRTGSPCFINLSMWTNPLVCLGTTKLSHKDQWAWTGKLQQDDLNDALWVFSSLVTQQLAEEGWGLVWRRTPLGGEARDLAISSCLDPSVDFRWEGRQCFDISVKQNSGNVSLTLNYKSYKQSEES